MVRHATSIVASNGREHARRAYEPTPEPFRRVTSDLYEVVRFAAGIAITGVVFLSAQALMFIDESASYFWSDAAYDEPPLLSLSHGTSARP